MQSDLPPGVVPPRPPVISKKRKKDDINTEKDVKDSQENDQAISTLYIRNLNEKVNLKMIKAALLGIFGTFGKVIKVYASKNIRMRGQGFVVMENFNEAQNAKEKVPGFPLFGKPMVVEFAKSNSKITEERLGNLEKFVENHQNGEKERQKKFLEFAEKARVNGLEAQI